MKTTSLYVRFLLINVVKFSMIFNIALTQSIVCRNCFLLTKTLHCNSATLLFLYNLKQCSRGNGQTIDIQ